MKDALGTRMKEFYENRTRFYLPRKTFVILRLDGCHFRTYTKGCEKPFDDNIISAMQNTTKKLLENIQGAVCGYTQSDEISILMTDLQDINSETWFNSNIQKMVSVGASMTSVYFNSERSLQEGYDRYNSKLAVFDGRCFSIPLKQEVVNYMQWRFQDCVRNSVQMLAQSQFSPKQLHGKHTDALKEMLIEKGIFWNELSHFKKYGTLFHRELRSCTEIKKIKGEDKIINYVRASWVPVEIHDTYEFSGIIHNLLEKF